MFEVFTCHLDGYENKGIEFDFEVVGIGSIASPTYHVFARRSYDPENNLGIKAIDLDFNLFSVGHEVVAGKLDVLRRHCEAEGTEYPTLIGAANLAAAPRLNEGPACWPTTGLLVGSFDCHAVAPRLSTNRVIGAWPANVMHYRVTYNVC